MQYSCRRPDHYSNLLKFLFQMSKFGDFITPFYREHRRINKISVITSDARIWYDVINILNRDIAEPGATQDFTEKKILEKLSQIVHPVHRVLRVLFYLFPRLFIVFLAKRYVINILAKILSRKHRKNFISKGYYNET